MLSTEVHFPPFFIQIEKQRLQYEKIVSIGVNQLKIQTWKVCGLWGFIVAEKLFVVDSYLGSKNDFFFECGHW